MTLNLHAPDTEEQLQPRITVVGVGGAGGNAVNNMITSNLEGVEFLICNTDAQALAQSLCQNRVQLGRGLTRGLGGGSRPEVGRAAAEEAIEDIAERTGDSDMLFIAAGMGGATGTGAAPVIARTAREKGILTVAVVTKPFTFEGVHRARVAEQGIKELEAEVDTLIIIPNQNLFRVANEKTTFADAFKMADEVLYSGVRGVTDLVVKPGLINLDFADIRSVMTEMGKAMMGTGEAQGENRAIAAAEAAISNPLLDDVSMKGARGVLINITGGPDLTLFEVDEAANRIRDEVDESANIIFGSTYDASMEGDMRISVVATGIESEEQRQTRPVTLSVVSNEQPRHGQEEPAAQRRPAAEPAQATPATAATATGAPEPTGEAAAATAETPGGGAPAAMSSGNAAIAESPEDDGEDPLVLDREEAFIAPEPVKAPRRPNFAADESRAREPQGKGLAPGAEDRRGEKARGARGHASSLISRITGAARAVQGGGEAEPPREPAPTRRAEEPQLATRRGERTEPTPAPVPKAEPRPQAPRSREATAQPRLSGLEPADRGDGRAMEEDQLDIPAFLRRQAN